MNTEQILTRIRAMFDVPVMQNNLRGLWVELMIAEILGPDWKQVGNDWAPWDLERSDGFRVEVKQAASTQSLGKFDNLASVQYRGRQSLLSRWQDLHPKSFGRQTRQSIHLRMARRRRPAHSVGVALLCHPDRTAS